MPIDADTFERTRRNTAARLLAERHAAGHWEGELASSALAGATAIVALSLYDEANGQTTHRQQIDAGRRWLIDHQNEDGGWGDTVRSHSNISTTMLCWAALGIERSAFGVQRSGEQGSTADARRRRDDAVGRAETWLRGHAGSLEADALTDAVMRRYGKDRTFSVPILTMCALAGRLGDPDQPAAWSRIDQLPFELAALPQSWFPKLNLRVVSYALPALIAIGLCRHTRRPTRNPLLRFARNAVTSNVLRTLTRIQPAGGGFLEATPLTAFVTMSLVGAGRAGHPVAHKGAEFLHGSARDDGSWPIDTNLATWLTTLSVNALSAGGALHEHLDGADRETIRRWLIDQQHTAVHPYTNAPPGGWAWTDLPGGVPDADDTAGAAIALANLAERGSNAWPRKRGHGIPPAAADPDPGRAADHGLAWLAGLTNRDGGTPTFCRGWGKLAFDRSAPDLTAHRLEAQRAWGEPLDPCALQYLRGQQRPDGSWLPLWFGNQHDGDEFNPTYGTARVLPTFFDEPGPRDAALRWLTGAQNPDGGWGGNRGTPASVEETALAVGAIAETLRRSDAHGATEPPRDRETAVAAVERGIDWLTEHTDHGTRFEPSPIGFYFAKLWYFERLYPLIFTAQAFERAAPLLRGAPQHRATAAG